MSTVTISSDSLIRLPEEVKNRLGVGAGDGVEFVFDGELTVVKPVHGEENLLDKWVGIACGKGDPPSDEELIREIRELRGWDEWDFKDVER